MVGSRVPDRDLRAGGSGSLRETTLCLLMRGNPPRHVLLGYKKEGFGAGKITGFGGKVEPGETPVAAAVRELAEETGITAALEDLLAVGQLRFLFPRSPAWSQLVHVFLSERWVGVPREGREMRPAWYAVDQLPYEQMWQDSVYWLPRFLNGERIRGRFVFDTDNETVVDVTIDAWDAM
ncbi:MAG: 8-oxo-dGTP diphosphatase [Anaerolineae bacterium]